MDLHSCGPAVLVVATGPSDAVATGLACLDRYLDDAGGWAGPTTVVLPRLLLDDPPAALAAAERLAARHPDVALEVEARSSDAVAALVAVAAPTAAAAHAAGADLLVLRAGTDLDVAAVRELQAVLHAAERHGLAVPRGDRPGPAVFPRARLAGAGDDRSAARTVFEQISPSLPRWSTLSAPGDTAVLVRHGLLVDHPLVDPEYRTLAAALADLAVRAARLGHSTVAANRAFGAWTGPEDVDTPASREHDERLLHRRHPALEGLAAHFIRYETDAVDHFAEPLARAADSRPTLLIDLEHLSLQYDGTTRNAVSFLGSLHAAGGAGFDVTLQARPEIARHFGLERFGFPIVAAERQGTVYDLGFSLSPLSHGDAILALNRTALRWVVLHLDIIALRSLELRAAAWARKRVVHDALLHSDHVIAISRSSVTDARAYFGGLALDPQRVSVLAQGAAEQRFAAQPGDITLDDLAPELRALIQNGGFVLVMGNWYPHKQLAAALAALAGSDLDIVALGTPDEHLRTGGSRIRSIPTGRISDALLDLLRERCALLVYPTAYEGFGLPMVEAVAAGRRVVAFASAAVVETVEAVGLVDEVDLFGSFGELPDVVAAALAKPAPDAERRARVRRSVEFDRAIIEVLRRVADEPVDVERLRRRWAHFVGLAEYVGDRLNALERLSTAHDELLGESTERRAYIARLQARRSYRAVEAALRVLAPARRLLAAANRS